MRQGQNNRRPRRGSQHGGQQGGNRRPNLPNRNQSFDSNGPDTRVRGNAFQISEKYQALARDAYAAGDRVLAENYFQHAEHYIRLINSWNEQHAQAQADREAEMEAQRQARQAQRDARQPRDGAEGVDADHPPANGASATSEPPYAQSANGVAAGLFEPDRRDSQEAETLTLSNGSQEPRAVVPPEPPHNEAAGSPDAATDGDDAPAPRPRTRRRTRRTTRPTEATATAPVEAAAAPAEPVEAEPGAAE